MGRFNFLIAAALSATVSAHPSLKREDYNGTIPNTNNTGMIYDYADIEPSPELKWVPCFDNPQLTCARLQVPLDYADPSVGTTNIAYVKFTSSDPSAEDILFNPGGPGESGVSHVISGAEGLLANLGPNYNLVGFDPRGVNNSGPALTCFPGAAEAKASYKPSGKTTPLSEQYQSAKAFGEFCSKSNAETEAKYGGSVATAQDMAHFINLNHAQKGLDGEAKLFYYGISYGTALGQTFAALFPDQVGRMILDGNVYGVQHYTGVLPSDVDDTDAAFQSFFQYCHRAGPEKCAFYGNSTSPEEMEDRYIALLQKLREFPIVYSDPELSPVPGVVTDFDIANAAFSQSYQPMTNFPKMAEAMAELEQGKVDKLIAQQASAPDEPAPHAADYDSGEALTLITCIDANENFPLRSYEDYLVARELYRKKSYYGGMTSPLTNLLMCVGFSVTPPDSQKFPGFDVKGTNTSFPILFVNPIRDPITPLSSAHKMSELFPGSVVLAQDSVGHGVTTQESGCTKEYMLAYMAEGKLPAKDTVCQPDVFPFVDAPAKRSLYRRGTY